MSFAPLSDSDREAFETFEQALAEHEVVRSLAFRFEHNFPVTDDLLPPEPQMGQTFEWPRA